jgi:hypothetical protein
MCRWLALSERLVTTLRFVLAFWITAIE